jgi:hypothetical protein
VKVLQPKHLITWLTQVASLASRHEQITVRAAFFFGQGGLYAPPNTSSNWFGWVFGIRAYRNRI